MSKSRRIMKFRAVPKKSDAGPKKKTMEKRKPGTAYPKPVYGTSKVKRTKAPK